MAGNQIVSSSRPVDGVSHSRSRSHRRQRAPTSPAGRLRRRRGLREAARHPALRRRPELSGQSNRHRRRAGPDRHRGAESSSAPTSSCSKPKDVARGNGALLFEVSNRGRKGILPMMNQAAASLDPSDARELGDGFLLEQGFSLLWVGWQLDPPPGDPLLLRVYPPAAVGVTGLVRSDFVVRAPASAITRSATATTSPTLPTSRATRIP